MTDEYPDNWPREALQRIEMLEDENDRLKLANNKGNELAHAIIRNCNGLRNRAQKAEGEVDQLKTEMRDLNAALDDSKRITAILKSALELLYDEQNDAPQEIYSGDWELAMKVAEAALKAVEK